MTKKIISTEDRDLFRQTVGLVRKINTDKVLPGNPHKPKPIPRVKELDVHENMSTDIPDQELEILSVGDGLRYLAPGLQTKVLKKLRQGYFGVAAELDLHGLNSAEAKRQLLNFLHYCIEDGHRCVHIIHGKGFRSPDNQPILKNNLNLWLRQHNAVQAFCSASPKHGGTGAVFVLLQVADKFIQP